MIIIHTFYMINEEEKNKKIEEEYELFLNSFRKIEKERDEVFSGLRKNIEKLQVKELEKKIKNG